MGTSGSSSGDEAVTVEQVARALAPEIHLHSRDPHQPISVEAFLNRCQLVRGRGTASSGGLDLPSGMTVMDQGPMTGDSLAQGSSSTAFGGGEIDEISLFPLTAAPGTQPTANWSDVKLLQGYFSNIGEPLPQEPGQMRLGEPHFYNYQLQTLLGATVPKAGTSTVPMYCRIAVRNSYYLISYFGFFAYNGGLGLLASWGGQPLSDINAFEAHIGDWTRITAKVTIADDLVSLLYVDYEAHGDPNLVTSSAFSGKPLSQVPRIQAYSAWHSHEMYPTAGTQYRPGTGFFANDYTDSAGPTWNTAANLTFITDTGPSWVKFNGLWGADMFVSGGPMNTLKNGPQGPAFHWYWTSETKDGASPITQWDPSIRPALPAPVMNEWSPPAGTDVWTSSTVTTSWQPVQGATSYQCTIRRAGTPVSTTTVTGTSQSYVIKGTDMFFPLVAEVVALGSNRAPSAHGVSNGFYCGNSEG